MGCRFAVVLAATLFSISDSSSQDLASIGGKVYDAKTKETLPGATVYLANTAVGMASTSNGTCLLDKITPGKYDLTVSFIGYKTFSKSIVFEGNSIPDFNIYLEPKAIELKPVEITTKKSNNRMDFWEFRTKFLGQTQNSFSCEIINSRDIFVYKEGSKLYAVSHKPVEVVNYALGYRIFYELRVFVIDSKSKNLTIAGIPRFEDLAPKNKGQERRWRRARDQAYYGSIQHFIRSLKKGELKKNHFLISDSTDVEINEQKLLGGDSVIVYRGKLNLTFNPESFIDPRFPWRRMQETILNFVGNRVRIYDNGYYQSYRDILIFGYIARHLNIADLVPLGYQPHSKL